MKLLFFDLAVVNFLAIDIVHDMAQDKAYEYADAEEQQAIVEIACRIFYHTNSRRPEETTEVADRVDNGDTRCSSRTSKELGRNSPEQRNRCEHTSSAYADTNHGRNSSCNKHACAQSNSSHAKSYSQMPFTFLTDLGTVTKDNNGDECTHERKCPDKADFHGRHIRPGFKHLRNPHIDTIYTFTDGQEVSNAENEQKEEA